MGLGPARERHRDRFQDRGVLFAKRREVGPRQLQHDRVAERRDRGRASSMGEEGDFTDRRAATHLGHAAAVDINRKAARGHEVKCIGVVASADEHFASTNGKGDKTLLESGKLLGGHIEKCFDESKRRAPLDSNATPSALALPTRPAELIFRGSQGHADTII
jgi:hypothetical protein